MKNHLLEYLSQAKSESVRGLRILTEYFYATEIFKPIVDSKIRIISVFGSARRKAGTPEYEDAKKLGKALYDDGYAVVTGASMGIMEAANAGVAEGIISELKKLKKFKNLSQEVIINSKEFKKKLCHHSVGLKITLPFEPVNNPWVGVYATFHYFMIRKFFFGSLSSAFIACEGGWGTRDELFEILTLVQTGKSPLVPIIYVSPDPKHLTDDIKYCVKKGYISKEDLDLIDVVKDYKQALKIINKFYKVVDSVNYREKRHSVVVKLNNTLTQAQQKKLISFARTKYKDYMSEVTFGRRSFELKNFKHKSYGVLRKIIDGIC
jgi:uncharacterized protein (TIGR00730 family)